MIKDGTEKFKGIWEGGLPDMSDISDVIIKEKNIAFWQNMMTGKSGSDKKEVIRNDAKNIFIHETAFKSDVIAGFYLVYNEECDVLVSYNAEYHYYTPTEGEIRGWQNIEPRFVFTRDGKVYSGNEKYINTDSFPRYQPIDLRQKTILDGPVPNGMRCFHGGNVFEFNTETNNIIKSFYGNAVPKFDYDDDALRMVDTMGPWKTLVHVFLSDEVQPEDRELTKEEETFLSFELPKVDTSRFQRLFWQKKTFDSHEVTRMYQKADFAPIIVQKIKGNISVIRTFNVCAKVEGMLEKSFTKDDMIYHENYRVYLDGFKKPVSFKYFFGKWYPVEESVCYSYYTEGSFLLPWTPDCSKGTALSILDDCVYGILKDVSEENCGWFDDLCKVSRYLLSIVCNPYAKSLYECPFENIKKGFALSLEIQESMTSCAKYFDITYTDYVNAEYGASLMRAINLPAHMIKTWDKTIGKSLGRYSKVDWEQDEEYRKFYFAMNSLMKIKYFFRDEESYFRNMNDVQFKEIMDILISAMESRAEYSFVSHNTSNHANCIRNMVSMFGPKNIKAYLKYLYFDISDMEYPGNKDNRRKSLVLRTRDFFCDYIKMCSKIMSLDEEFKKPRWKFKTPEEVKTYHDEITYLYNLRVDEMEAKKHAEQFDKVKGNWNKYLYSEDMFSVIAPKSTLDIANEGIALNHCVKSYIDDVLDNSTNILFIRKTSELDTPFYTLEIKDNKIRQCHGFNNQNVEKAEGLEEFLERYCDRTKVKYQNPDQVLAVD